MENSLVGIRSKLDIVEVISSYIPLTLKGKNYVGVCPFHDDTRPSLSVSSSLQIYKCFACGHAGNVFNFVMDFEHVDFKGALSILAKKYSIDIKGIDVKSENKLDNYYKMNGEALAYFKNNLNSNYGVSAKDYLKNRKLDEDTIREFEIGLSIKDKSNLTNIMLTKGYTIDALNRMDLSNGEYDTFINRIIFPIHDFSANIIGFSGRIYDDSELSKYQNTKMTPVFKKGEVIFNYHRVRDSVRLKKSIIVMEGFMAVIRAHTIGVNNCVALMGTSMTSSQLMSIKRLSNNIVLCFDGDKAGVNATIKNGEELIKHGVNPKVICLTDGDDPDDYIIKYGRDAFLSLVDSATSFNEFKIKILRGNFDLRSEEGKTCYINSVLEELAKSDDDIKTELTLKKLAKEFDLWYNTLDKKLSTFKMNKSANINLVTKIDDNKRISKYEKANFAILSMMLTNNSLIEKVIDSKVRLLDENSRYLMGEIVAYYRRYLSVNYADFYTYISDKKDLIEVIDRVSGVVIHDDLDGAIDDYLKVINEYNLSQEIKRLSSLLKSEVDPLRQAEILEKIRGLRMKESE